MYARLVWMIALKMGSRKFGQDPLQLRRTVNQIKEIQRDAKHHHGKKFLQPSLGQSSALGMFSRMVVHN